MAKKETTKKASTKKVDPNATKRKVWVDRKFQGITELDPGQSGRDLHNKIREEVGEGHTIVVGRMDGKMDIKDPELAKKEYADRRKTSANATATK